MKKIVYVKVGYNVCLREDLLFIWFHLHI